MTDDFFRSRLDQMIDPRHPLAVLAQRLPWQKIETRLAPLFAHQARPLRQIEEASNLLGAVVSISGGKVSNAGRPRLSMRLMVALSLLKNSFDLSDEALVERFAENVYWQYFAGYDYFDPRPPCDATQIGRFRTALGEAGLEELLRSTIHTALDVGAVKKSEFERVIVDTTVQEKAIAHPVDSRLLDIGRRKVVAAAKRCGMVLKQTFEAEGRALRRRAGGYAHARQFKRLKRAVKRQRTILGIVIRDARRRLLVMAAPSNAPALASLNMWLERAERIRTQQRHDKRKLYALHAPEVECIAKGKARKPYEFGVKVSVAITHKQGLIVGARSFPGNPWDGHTLAEQIEQSTILLEDIGVKPRQVVVDLGYRGKDVDAANPGVEIIHRGRYKTMSQHERQLLKRRQAVEPAIGHLKADCRMNRCWLKGSMGDALHALSCAVGYNLRWLMRAVVRLGLTGFLFALLLTRWMASLASRYVVHEPRAAPAKMAQA
jgi:IS5 family transposase